ARIPVGEHTAEEQGRQHCERLEREHEAERARLAGQGGDAPAERDDEGSVTDERDHLPAPEQAEVTAPERCERSWAGLGHPRRLSSAPCSELSSSTSISRSPDRARTSAPRVTCASGAATGSSWIRRATRRL